MTIDELKTYVRMMLNAAFPTATIQFERVSDDPFHIGVGVYGVATNATKWIEDKILDIDEKICANTEFVITPLVRDEATTDKYYPELSTPWKVSYGTRPAVAPYQYQTEIDVDDLGMILQENSGEWQHEKPAETAANEELALAA